MTAPTILWKRNLAPGHLPRITGYVRAGEYLLAHLPRPANAWYVEFRPRAGGVLFIGQYRALYEAQKAALDHAASHAQ